MSCNLCKEKRRRKGTGVIDIKVVKGLVKAVFSFIFFYLPSFLCNLYLYLAFAPELRHMLQIKNEVRKWVVKLR